MLDRSASSGPWVSVEKYRAGGEGADDVARIQAALDNEQFVTFGAGPAPLTYLVSGQLTLHDGQWIDGAGATIKPTGSSSFDVFRVGGSTGARAVLDTDAAEEARTLTLVPGSVAALGLVIGSHLLITDDEQRSQVTRVTGVRGEALTLVDPLGWSFATARRAGVARISPVTVHVFNLRVDGSGNTGRNTTGLRLYHLLNGEIVNAEFVGLRGAGLYLDTGYATVVRGCRDHACGNDNVAAFSASRQSRFMFSDIHSRAATGFGPTIGYSAHGGIRGLSSVAPARRCFKLQTSSHCRGYDVRTDCCARAYTGFGIVRAGREARPRRNVFHGVSARGNGGSAIWIDGDLNEVYGVTCADNVRDIEVIGGEGNRIEGEFSDADLIDTGTDTLLVLAL